MFIPMLPLFNNEPIHDLFVLFFIYLPIMTIIYVGIFILLDWRQ